MRSVRIASVGLMAALGIAATAASPARASQILSLTGITQIQAPASDVPPSDPRSPTTQYPNSTMFIWSEQTNLRLDSNGVMVDMSGPGMSDTSNNFKPSAASVGANTNVDSYLIHADPTGSGSPPTLYTGSVTFNEQILGIIDTSNRLNATDILLGNPSTTYPGSNGPPYPGSSLTRGLEGSVDSVVWVTNGGLTLNFSTGASIDEIRVIVASAPEPSTLISGGVGVAALLGFGWARRRRAGSAA